MKRLFILVLIVLFAVCAACGRIPAPVPSETASTGISPAPSPNKQPPAPPATKQPPVPAPNPSGETLVPFSPTADVIEPGIFQLLLDEPVTVGINDCTTEIEITDSDGSLSLSAVESGTEHRILIADIPAGCLVTAYYVLTSDRYPFVVVSYDYCSDDYETKVFSFSGSEPYEVFSLPLPVSKIDEFLFEASGYISAVGTWEVITTAYFVQGTVEWRGVYVLETESESYTEVIITRDLPVQLLHNGTYEASTLLPGAPISFNCTDGQSYMEFTLWDDTEGYFNFEWSSDWNEMINGVSAYKYFEGLPMFD